MALQIGAKGAEVKKVQNHLVGAGYSVGTAGADGVFGNDTASGVSAFQSANGLEATGIVDDATYQKMFGTSQTASATDLPKGVSKELWDKPNSSYVESEEVTKKKEQTGQAATTYFNIANQKEIIDADTMAATQKQFQASQDILNADRTLAEKLSNIQSGKTSYSDQVSAMIDKIMNRKDFSYDVDRDPLFQQALASAMSSGKSAMQDTIGQASALTGGYGSSYATSAGNQQYNAFIEDAYNNLPEYYQMALQAYQMEGDELYQQYGMLSAEDAKEYERLVAGYDALSQYRNQRYNEEYTQHQDSITNAYASANLQLNEYGQKVSNAYNAYNIMSNEEEKAYNRDYNDYTTGVANAWNAIQLLTNNAWNEQNQANWEKRYALDEKQVNAQIAKMYSSGGGGSKSSDSGKADTLSESQIKILGNAYKDAGGGEAGYAAVDARLALWGKTNIDPANIDGILQAYEPTQKISYLPGPTFGF